MQKVNWLIGEWRNWNKEGNLTEIWSPKNDSTLSGVTHFTVEIDTIFSEKIEIIQVKDSLFYNTKVSNQNDGKMVSFKNNDFVAVDLKDATAEYKAVDVNGFAVKAAKAIDVCFGD